jgi:lysophospholipase L1-like esterase
MVADQAPGPRARGAFVLAGLLMAVAGAALALLASEAALRVAGFQYHLMPAVQFGWPDPQTIKTNYADDPDLFWVTKDYHEKLRAARRAHSAIVFMGDSCTEFGQYPMRTIENLVRVGVPAATSIHVAAGGWTSEQGLAQLKRDILPLQPRVIVVYYGWNDHWIALGPTDPQLRRARPWLRLAEHSRLVQAGLKAWVGESAHVKERPVRVSPDEYLANLREIVRIAAGAGIVPVLVTAPSNHVAGHEPAYLAQRHVNRLADLVPLHQRYVALTRQAAGATGAVLCDAFDAFEGLPDKDGLFRADGIHFTDRGDAVLGQLVSACIARALSKHSD